MTSVVGRGLRKECEGQAGSRNDTGDDEDDEVLLFNVGHVVSPGKSSAKKAPKLRDDKAHRKAHNEWQYGRNHCPSCTPCFHEDRIDSR